jgi:uncharacterized protein YegL
MDHQTPYVEKTFTAAATSGFASAEFAENPEQRLACLLLLDTSGSMSGQPINELNIGLKTLQDELAADTLASKRVEVGIYTFGPPTLVSDFTTATQFHAPTLQASGDTPMGAAITQGLQHLDERKNQYRVNGVGYYRPWVFLITDGAPTDSYQAAAQQVHIGESSGKFSFYAVGVKGANMVRLAEISPLSRPPVQLDGLRFRDLFLWLSKSVRTVSASTPGTQASLTVPGWISAQT